MLLKINTLVFLLMIIICCGCNSSKACYYKAWDFSSMKGIGPILNRPEKSSEHYIHTKDSSKIAYVKYITSTYYNKVIIHTNRDMIKCVVQSTRDNRNVRVKIIMSSTKPNISFSNGILYCELVDKKGHSIVKRYFPRHIAFIEKDKVIFKGSLNEFIEPLHNNYDSPYYFKAIFESSFDPKTALAKEYWVGTIESNIITVAAAVLRSANQNKSEDK